MFEDISNLISRMSVFGGIGSIRARETPMTEERARHEGLLQPLDLTRPVISEGF